MLQQRKHYRKKIDTNGFVFMAGREMQIKVCNLSVKGFLAEVKDPQVVNDLEQVFTAIKLTTRVDFYLPELGLAGDAELVRVDLVSNVFLLALEFKEFSKEVNNALYKRKAYRKRMLELGNLTTKSSDYAFITRNVSQDGIMLQILDKTELQQGMITDFDLKKLQVQGEGKIVWLQEKGDETFVGLQFVDIDRTLLDSIPRFAG